MDMETELARLSAAVFSMSERIDGLNKAIDHWAQAQCTDRLEIERLTALVAGRNKSAPLKRNMVDADALRVLTGDLKDQDHKDAAEIIGLTYAQVYSCRLEFTFKHVHKALKNDKWKNPWAKA
jgi:hypothetical protein